MTLSINFMVLIAVIILSIAAGAMIGYSLDFLIKKRNDLDLDKELKKDKEEEK